MLGRRTYDTRARSGMRNESACYVRVIDAPQYFSMESKVGLSHEQRRNTHPLPVFYGPN